MSRADDVKRARAWLYDWMNDEYPLAERGLADLIAEVRAEALEAAAVECDKRAAYGPRASDEVIFESAKCAHAIRALQDKAPR
jgi:hypothetical protein